MKTLTTIALSAALLAISPLAAIATTHSSSAPSGGETASRVAGEVRKIDKSAKKITIKHEELKDFDMPAMTMVFQVKDPSILDKVKPGDQVEFVAEKVEGRFTVTEIDVK